MGTAIIDFHSHILPALDDGSKDVATSIEMINSSASQGVEMMVATPHFYADRNSVEHFLEKRGKAYEKLRAAMPELPLQIRIGAEVAFFKGISRAEKLDVLTIEGTNLLLLEMPFAPWSASDIQEVEQILDRGYRVMLAHLERYLMLPECKKWVREITQLPVIVQINAQSLLEWRRRRQIIQMFQKDEAQVLGSDCHGIHHRPPNLSAGREVLEKKLGSAFLAQMDSAGSRILEI